MLQKVLENFIILQIKLVFKIENKRLQNKVMGITF